MRDEKRPRVIALRVTEDEGAYLDALATQDRRTVAELGYFAFTRDEERRAVSGLRLPGASGNETGSKKFRKPVRPRQKRVRR